MLHAGTTQDKIVPDVLWRQRETLQDKATREIRQLKLELTEHAKKEVEKIEPAKVIRQRKIAMRTCADSLALPEGFAKLECPLVSSYPTIIKSSTDFKIQRIGWSTTWRQ